MGGCGVGGGSDCIPVRKSKEDKNKLGKELPGMKLWVSEILEWWHRGGGLEWGLL